MPKIKKTDLKVEKSKEDQMLDAILGPDEDLSDDLAAEILAEYGIDEATLLDNFVNSVNKHLRSIPADGDESKKLGAMIRNISAYKRQRSGENVSPRDWIAGLMGGLVSRQPKTLYAFRKSREGDLSDTDKEILDEIKQELSNESDDE
jgi:hypothetical protein